MAWWVVASVLLEQLRESSKTGRECRAVSVVVEGSLLRPARAVERAVFRVQFFGFPRACRCRPSLPLLPGALSDLNLPGPQDPRSHRALPAPSHSQYPILLSGSSDGSAVGRGLRVIATAGSQTSKRAENCEEVERKR